MSDSTIDDAIRLLEVGKGNPDRLKQIIKSFETRSLIPLHDRRYVEALVAQYLTPRHRVTIKKIEPIRKQKTDYPRIRKPAPPTFDPQTDNDPSEKLVKGFDDNLVAKEGLLAHDRDKAFDPQTDNDPSENKVKITELNVEKNEGESCVECDAINPSGNNFCNECGSPLQQTQKVESTSEISKVETEFEKYEREYLERQSGVKTDSESQEPSLEEEFVEYIESEKPSRHKKSNVKFIGIGVGIVAILIIAGGAAFMATNMDLSSSSRVEDRATCDNKLMLVSSTKIPGFPNPEKDLQYYLDRYNNEPSYADWFNRNFSGQTIEEVLVIPSSGPAQTKIPGFPDPEKDLQYYLDRYNNEPSYADWFNRNFSGQTIQDVIC